MSEIPREQIPLGQVLVPEAIPEKHETIDIQVEEPERDGTLETYMLHSQARTLVLTVYHQETLGADTWIYATPNKEKQSGETSALYSKVAEILQGLANQEQRAVDYTFSTMFPQLISWAADEGFEIFRWDWVDTDLYKGEDEGIPSQLRGTENVRYFNASRKFLPQK